MKKLFFLILCLAMTSMSFAQDKSNIGDVRWSFGLGLDILDQYTPTRDGLQTFKAPIDLGQSAWVWANINSSVAIEAGIGYTGIVTRSDDNMNYEEKNTHLFNVEGGLVYKFNNGYILKENFPVAPFIFAKVKGSYIDLTGIAGEDWGIGVPVGGGINFRVANDIALNTQVGYTFGVTDDFDNNLTWTFGVMFDLGTPKVIEVPIDTDGDGLTDDVDACPETPGPAENAGCPYADTDGDGVIDDNDNCPEVAGLAKFDGCPDSDDDGVMDSEDDCPDVPGLAKFNGCPDTDGDGVQDSEDDCPDQAGTLNGCPDADGDGILDSEDDCPKVPGVAALKGCPDADGDGIKDSEDRCPTEAGTAENKGCPAVKEEVIERLEFIAKNIQFETNSSVIKTSSFSILDEIVKILGEWPNYSVKVSGHTDSVGSEESNMELSKKRAESAANYLISKGVDASRVESAGFGETQPIRLPACRYQEK